jgi:hypothetical protein
MTLVPIIDRELRLAARKRSTFWLRVAAALTGFIFTLAIFGIEEMKRIAGFGTGNFGGVLFGVLTWLGLAAALAAGIFFTADCLSEEKREGTLGFLFLTDLRGYDVAGGKLLATSLRAAYAFLALVPILATALLMGGVTAAQFWKTSLALLNALFCSLACGLFVSAMSRDSQKAFAGTFLLLLMLTFGGVLADLLLEWVTRQAVSAPLLSVTSPGYVFAIAGEWGKAPFWTGLLISHGIAWVMFVLACVLVRRTWHQKEAKPATTRNSQWIKYGSAKRRLALRRKLLARSPIIWLACRERWQALGIWIIAALAVIAFAIPFASNLPPMKWMIWNYVGGLFSLALYLGAASQASRFFVEARKTGVIELLLAAPLGSHEIIRGQWRGLLRMFTAPVLLILVVQCAAAALAQHATWGSLNSGQMENWMSVAIAAGTGVAGIISSAANMVALVWFGMWMGVTSRNTSLATLKAFAFVEVVPWLVIAFASAMVIPLLMMLFVMPRFGGGSGSTAVTAVGMMWFPLASVALSTTLSLGKDFAFIFWSRNKLYSSLRERLVSNWGTVHSVPQAPVLTPTAAPPVISTGTQV